MAGVITRPGGQRTSPLLAQLLGSGSGPGRRLKPGQAVVRPPQPGAAPATPGLGANMNPYTHRPLGANEYVGVAGSEADHPGMTRIPPPGWWDPTNPNYERRNYYVAPDGKIVAREAGFDPSSDDPWDTGREGEVNGEYEGRAGGQSINLGEPGVTRWHAGQPKPGLPGYQPTRAPGLANFPQLGPGAGTRSIAADALNAIGRPPQTSVAPDLAGLLGGPPSSPQVPSAPQDQYSALIQALLGKLPNRPGPGGRAY